MASWTAAWDGYFADPFVLPTREGYYAFGTDGPEDAAYRQFGQKFPVLFSRDLSEWSQIGAALEVSGAQAHSAFWAPAVAEVGGRFVMFYSEGRPQGEGHRLRVATSSNPEGPYVPEGDALMPSLAFSIDAHPFRDPASGKWYLFFARDFLNAPVGTGLAVAGLSPDLKRVVTKPKTILRGGENWHVYERDRTWYGKRWRRWHTCEGPSVAYREGRWWLLYSGGNWQGEGYGVAVAVASAPTGPYAPLEGHLLATRRGPRGPGHCCTFDDDEGAPWIAFHAWDAQLAKRQMFIRRMAWTSDGPQVL